MKWSSNQTELKRLEKFNTAYQFSQSKEKLTQSEAELQNSKDTIASLEKSIVQNKGEVRKTTETINQLTRKKRKRWR
jgi:hypothetical protein